MHTLSSEQESAMALLKDNLHLPEGGFHKLILELCKEYLLPFQQVRAVLKKSQSAIEREIRDNFTHINENALTQENWINLIKQKLTILSKGNQPVMQSLTTSALYLKTTETLNMGLTSERSRDTIIANLFQIYESEVYKPLSAMLYTSDLYWYLSDDLAEMNHERCQKFHDYPQHMEAIEHLNNLKQKIETALLKDINSVK